jgi:hypothetical protein
MLKFTAYLFVREEGGWLKASISLSTRVCGRISHNHVFEEIDDAA